MDELKRMQEKYKEKGQPYTELEEDAGSLGKTGSDYGAKKKSRAGRLPFGSQDEKSKQED